MEMKGNHIDEVFRERLSDLNVTPPTDAWSEIENRVHRRKMILFTVPRLVAASLLLFVLTGSLWLIFLRKPSDNGLADQPVFSSHTQKDHPSASLEKTKTAVRPAGETIRKTERPAGKRSAENTAPAEAVKQSKATPLYPAFHRAPVTTGTPVMTGKAAPAIPATQMAFLTPKNAVVLYGQKHVAPTLDHNLMNQYIQAEALPVSPVLKNQPAKKGTWGIGGDFGPVYAYRHLSEGSPVILSYMNAVENGIVSFAGNVSFFYERSRRFTVQSGIGYYRLGQEVSDVVAFRMKKSGGLATLESKGNDFIQVSEGKLGYSGTPVFVANRKAPGGNDQVEFLLIRLGADTYEPVDARLKQDLEFVEIPILLRYKVIDKTMGLNIIGGMGTSVLVKGQTSVITGQGTTLIGDLYELQKTNFNGTFGLGLSYNLSTTLRLRLEPVVKYYLNPVYKSPEMSTHPYSIGIYSGMSFYF